MAIVALGLGGVWMVKTMAPPAPPVVVPQDVKPANDPLGDLPAELRQDLVRPQAPAVPGRFAQPLLGDPRDLCGLLDELGMQASSWQPDPYFSGGWQCSTEVVPLTTASVDYKGSTLFVMVRGSRKGEVDHLRLKLVVPDPKQVALAQQNLDLVLGTLTHRYRLSPPEGFREAIAGFQKFQAERQGVRYRVLPEDPDLVQDETAARRLNILLSFPDTPLVLRADSYVPRKK